MSWLFSILVMLGLGACDAADDKVQIYYYGWDIQTRHALSAEDVIDRSKVYIELKSKIEIEHLFSNIKSLDSRENYNRDAIIDGRLVILFSRDCELIQIIADSKNLYFNDNAFEMTEEFKDAFTSFEVN